MSHLCYEDAQGWQGSLREVISPLNDIRQCHSSWLSAVLLMLMRTLEYIYYVRTFCKEKYLEQKRTKFNPKASQIDLKIWQNWSLRKSHSDMTGSSTDIENKTTIFGEIFEFSCKKADINKLFLLIRWSKFN